MNPAILHTNLPFLKREGKVRDIYDVGTNLLLVSTDRISGFDRVIPNGVSDKGRILTQLSAFWFDILPGRNHMLSTNTAEICSTLKVEEEHRDGLDGRCMLVRKTEVVPIECVVRGHIDGSGWKEYQESQTVCGIPLPAGLKRCQQLDEPIFTPATKEETGHDINISFERMVEIVGSDTAHELRQRSIEIYRTGAEYARKRGIIIADTKFEWGKFDKDLILIDEVLTPDSSRFWPADQYEPGRSQVSIDKQYVRDWLTSTDWDKNSPPPPLPADVVAKTREKYIEAFERLTDRQFQWR